MPALRDARTQGRHLGRPVISVSSSPRYLRQRIVAEQERRARRDRIWRRRVWIGGCLIALYVLIGRDVAAMVWAAGRAALGVVQSDIHRTAVAIGKIIQASNRERAASSPSPGDDHSGAGEIRGEGIRPAHREHESSH